MRWCALVMLAPHPPPASAAPEGELPSRVYQQGAPFKREKMARVASADISLCDYECRGLAPRLRYRASLRDWRDFERVTPCGSNFGNGMLFFALGSARGAS